MTVKTDRRYSSNPKRNKLTVRMDDRTLRILDAYCKAEGISRMEGMRRGIMRLK
ncbi:hypothetical protein LJC42_05595 [Eubacteriales bacterium OttesenSCG-928-K08]|nr:hypothetical protein [Eubacteriales bacterium OttesenSCG-928-K08]